MSNNHPLLPSGISPVSYKSFYDRMNSLNVHPKPLGDYDHEWGYLSKWEMQDGTVIGFSCGGTYLRERLYFLVDRS